MTWIDYIIIAVIAVSAVIGVLRGFIREAVSLLFWVLGFGLAFAFSDVLSKQLMPFIESNAFRTGLSFLIIFLVAITIGVLVSTLSIKLIQKTGLTSTDRLLGLFFGVARGILVIALLLLVAGTAELSTGDGWLRSTLIGYFSPLVDYLKTLLPVSVLI